MLGVFLGHALEQLVDDLELGVVGRLVEQRRLLLGGVAAVDQQRRVAAVVHDQLRAFAVRPGQRAVGEVPVLVQRLTLEGEDRRAHRRDGGGRVILRREDVARGPAHVRAELLQGLDQHRGLDGHVQRAGDARALQRLLGAVLLPGRHQAGHLVLGDGDLFAAPVGQPEVLDDVIFSSGLAGGADRYALSHGVSCFFLSVIGYEWRRARELAEVLGRVPSSVRHGK